VQWALAYAAGAWAVLQALSLLISAYHWPDALLRIAIVAAAIGFLVTLVLAWYHSERGAQRLSRNEMLLLAILIALAGGLLWRTVHEPQPASSLAAADPVSGGSLTAIPDITNDPSIAVLPFVNMSSDKEQEYFSDGISEELLNLLAKVPKLRVIARTSSFSFKGKEAAIPEIARALNVAAILEGSVRKSGDTVRITVQLIRASDSTHLWSETYDRQLNDIFKVQDEIAATVVAQLKIKLLGAAPTSKVIDPKAYALFLQAREVSRQNSTLAYEQSISLYQQALAIDPDYAAAWVGLAGTYSSQVYQYVRPAGEAIPLARTAIAKALAIDPDFAPAYAQISWIEIFYDRDLAAAARHLERALALDPSNTDVLTTAASLARRLGRFEQSISISEYLLARDPVNAAGYDDLGFAYFYAGRQNDGVAAFRTVLRLSPSYAGEHANLGWVFLIQGDAKAGMSEAQLETDPQFKLFVLAVAHFALGQKAQSDAILADAIKRYRTTSAINIAAVYAFRGEADQTFEWLDKALQNHEPDIGAVPALTYFAKLKSDPRWLPFLRKASVAPEQLAKIEFKVTLPDQGAPQ
jgi:TolB-like protein/Tfp pilus assembly protein PilF